MDGRMNPKLKIFTDERYIHNGKLIPMLYPFWGKPEEGQFDPNSGRFDNYINIGKTLFEITPIEDADIAVLPSAWEHVRENKNALRMSKDFVKHAKDHGKKTIVYFISDLDENIPIKDIVVFRTSFYKSKQKNNEFAIPGWSEDFISKYFNGNIPIRQKQKKPVVGFCGMASPKRKIRGKFSKIMANIKNLSMPYKNILIEPGHLTRYKALDILLKNKDTIDNNFITYDEFWGGLYSLGNEDSSYAIKKRLEYVKNIVNSDYTVCARGDGNFSYRLYETLSCGRIPILINTDCVLPYENILDWSKFCIIVEKSELNDIAKKVKEFHDNISNEEFIKLQHECRDIWKKWISPEGFFSNINLLVTANRLET